MSTKPIMPRTSLKVTIPPVNQIMVDQGPSTTSTLDPESSLPHGLRSNSPLSDAVFETPSCGRPPYKSSLSYSSGRGSISPSGAPRPSKGCSVQINEPPLCERKGFDSPVKSEHKRGLLYNAIPSMPLPVAILCCVLNIIIPGSGTLVSSFMVFCCGTTTRCESKVKAFALNLLTAVLQFLTFIFIVGWVWSITWGMAFVQLALSTEKEEVAVRSALPYYVRRHSSVG